MTKYVKTPNHGPLNLRQIPHGGVIGKIPDGTKLQVEVDGDWAKTTYLGKEGYVQTFFLVDNSKEVTKEDLKRIYDSLSETLKLIKEVL